MASPPNVTLDNHIKWIRIYIEIPSWRSYGTCCAMSRLPSPSTLVPCIPELGEMVMLLETLETSTVGVKDIIRWTQADPVLSKIYDYCLNGWPSHAWGGIPSDLRSYYHYRKELTEENGCVLRRNRVVHTTTRKYFTRIAQFTSGHLQNEGHCEKLCVLAQYWLWVGTTSKRL